MVLAAEKNVNYFSTKRLKKIRMMPSSSKRSGSKQCAIQGHTDAQSNYKDEQRKEPHRNQVGGLPRGMRQEEEAEEGSQWGLPGPWVGVYAESCVMFYTEI